MVLAPRWRDLCGLLQFFFENRMTQRNQTLVTHCFEIQMFDLTLLKQMREHKPISSMATYRRQFIYMYIYTYQDMDEFSI